MKKCVKCELEKDINDFNNHKKEKDGKSKQCKLCSREYSKKLYYESHKERHNKRIVARRRRIKNELDLYINLLELKCIKCGNNHPAVLDFHHRDPNIKKDTISNLKWAGISFDQFKIELDKCDVLCSNCHRILHYNEKNSIVSELADEPSCHEGEDNEIK